MSARPDRCWLTSGRWYLNCDSCLIYERVRTVYHSSHILNLEWIWSWSITDGRPYGLLRCPDGCKLEQNLFDTVEGPDGKTHRPDGWNSWQMGVQTRWYVVRTADRESKIVYHFRSAESSKNALTSGISVYSIFTHKWFCPNTEWGQNTNSVL
jgi:hypothetical protein